jgi:ankyrin repeat protein
VAVLLDRGASLEARDNRGVTPLVYACHIGRVGMVGTLLAAGANASAAAEDGTTCLHAAASRGGLSVVTEVLQRRKRKLISLNVDQSNDDGQSALHVAAEASSAEVVRLLIKAGAEVDKRAESTGATPLMCAARAGRDAPLAALLKAGADANVKGNHRIYQVRRNTRAVVGFFASWGNSFSPQTFRG